MDTRNEVASLLASLADPSRLRVLGVLAEADYCVTEVAARVGLSQSCTTRHLQTLQRAGVLSRVRDGKKVRFRIRRDDVSIERLVEFVLLRQGRLLPLAVDLGGASVHAPRPSRDPAAALEPPRDAHALQRSPAAPRVIPVTPAGAGRPDAVTIPARSPLRPTDSAEGIDREAAGATRATDVPPVAAAPELEDYLL